MAQDYQNYSQNVNAVSNAMYNVAKAVSNHYNKEINEAYNHELNDLYTKGLESYKKDCNETIHVHEKVIEEMSERLQNVSSPEEKVKLEKIIAKATGEKLRAETYLENVNKATKQEEHNIENRKAEISNNDCFITNLRETDQTFYTSEYKSKDGGERRIGTVYNEAQYNALSNEERSRLTEVSNRDREFVAQQLEIKNQDLRNILNEWNGGEHDYDLSDYYSYNQTHFSQIRYGFTHKTEALQMIQACQEQGIFVSGTTTKVNGQYVVQTARAFEEEAMRVADQFHIELQHYEEYEISTRRDPNENVGHGYMNPLEQGIATSEAGATQRNINQAFSMILEWSRPHENSRREERTQGFEMVERDLKKASELKEKVDKLSLKVDTNDENYKKLLKTFKDRGDKDAEEKAKEKWIEEKTLELQSENEIELMTLSDFNSLLEGEGKTIDDISNLDRKDFIKIKKDLLKKYEKTFPIDRHGNINLKALKKMSKAEMDKIGMTEAERKFLLKTMADKKKSKGANLYRIVRTITRKSDLDYQWIADIHHAKQRADNIYKTGIALRDITSVPIKKRQESKFKASVENDDVLNNISKKNTKHINKKENKKKVKKAHFQGFRRKKEELKDKMSAVYQKTLLGRLQNRATSFIDRLKERISNLWIMRLFDLKTRIKKKLYLILGGFIASMLGLCLVILLLWGGVTVIGTTLMMPVVAVMNVFESFGDGSNEGGLKSTQGTLTEEDVSSIVYGVQKHYYGDDESNEDWLARKPAIEWALSYVGTGKYSNACHGYMLGQCPHGGAIHTDCSGFVSCVYLSNGGSIGGICSTTGLAPSGTPTFLGDKGASWDNVYPADAVVYHSGKAYCELNAIEKKTMPAHALLYIGIVDEDITLSSGAVLVAGQPITVDCTSRDGEHDINIAQKTNLGQNHIVSTVYIKSFR